MPLKALSGRPLQLGSQKGRKNQGSYAAETSTFDVDGRADEGIHGITAEAMAAPSPSSPVTPPPVTHSSSSSSKAKGPSTRLNTPPSGSYPPSLVPGQLSVDRYMGLLPLVERAGLDDGSSRRGRGGRASSPASMASFDGSILSSRTDAEARASVSLQSSSDAGRDKIRLLNDLMMMTYVRPLPSAEAMLLLPHQSTVHQQSQPQHNDMFCYQDTPAARFRKEVHVRSGLEKKTVGSTLVKYDYESTDPGPRGPAGRKLSSKAEAISFFNLHRQQFAASALEAMDFRPVYCVCHQPQDDREYVECSMSVGGCNGWLHLDCVGLSSAEVERFSDVEFVCPLCADLLEKTGNAHLLAMKWVLRCRPPLSSGGWPRGCESAFKPASSGPGSYMQDPSDSVLVNGMVFKQFMQPMNSYGVFAGDQSYAYPGASPFVAGGNGGGGYSSGRYPEYPPSWGGGAGPGSSLGPMLRNNAPQGYSLPRHNSSSHSGGGSMGLGDMRVDQRTAATMAMRYPDVSTMEPRLHEVHSMPDRLRAVGIDEAHIDDGSMAQFSHDSNGPKSSFHSDLQASTASIKRGRGRPRKYPRRDENPHSSGAADGSTPSSSQMTADVFTPGASGNESEMPADTFKPKRGRGRPRGSFKVRGASTKRKAHPSPVLPLIGPDGTVIKRPRGRPRKYPLAGTESSNGDTLGDSDTESAARGGAADDRHSSSSDDESHRDDNDDAA